MSWEQSAESNMGLLWFQFLCTVIGPGNLGHFLDQVALQTAQSMEYMIVKFQLARAQTSLVTRLWCFSLLPLSPQMLNFFLLYDQVQNLRSSSWTEISKEKVKEIHIFLKKKSTGYPSPRLSFVSFVDPIVVKNAPVSLSYSGFFYFLSLQACLKITWLPRPAPVLLWLVM